MDSETIDQLIAGNNRLEPFREKLEAMQLGTYCIHRSWGFGRIQGYDEGSGKLLIDFEGGKDGHGMDPAFCVDKLEILPAESLLVRSREEPEAVRGLLESDRVAVIIGILTTRPEGAATAAEIERQLAFLLPEEKKRKRWWTEAKKELVREPRVAVPAKKTEPYVLREEEEKRHPEEEILEEFYETKKAKQKVILAEKLYAVAKDGKGLTGDSGTDAKERQQSLQEKLPDILDELTQRIQDTKLLGQADRLHGVWVRNNLARYLAQEKDSDVDVDALEPTSGSIVEESVENLDKLAAELPASYQERFLDLLSRTYPDRWEEMVVRLLRHSEGRFTGECIAFLYDRGKADRVQECFERWLNEQTMRGPILLWIIRNREKPKYSELIDGLLTPRFLNAVFYAIDQESLQNASSRRIPLADALSEDSELIPMLLKRGTPENARDLAQMLLLNQGFEDLTKKSLLARFIKQDKSIQSLLEREAAEETETEKTLTVSAESLAEAREEYEDLVQRKIPENKQAIETAKEHGDLRENAEYKMARQDQDTLLARKAELDRDLSRARVTDFSEATVDTVGIGNVVELREGSTGQLHRYAILGAWDGKPDRNILSYLTPVGQAVLGRRRGDQVETEIDGTRETWTIESIGRWVDETN